MTTKVEVEGGRSVWRFERGVNPFVALGFVGSMLAAVVGYTWTVSGWVSASSATVVALQKDVAALSRTVEDGDKRLIERSDERYRSVLLRLEGLDSARAGDTIRITRLEEQFKFVAEALARIERKLDVAPTRR